MLLFFALSVLSLGLTVTATPSSPHVASSDLHHLQDIDFNLVDCDQQAAINAPLNCNSADSFMGSKVFNSGLIDESLCAAVCTAKTV
jgi:hypothetical protein